MKINWDDILPETKIAEWHNILQNVNVMNSLKLERHYLKMFDLKEIRNVLIGLTPSSKPWEIAVGQVIGRVATAAVGI